MAVTGVNNYTDYTNYYTDTKKVSEGTQKTADKQKTDKSHSSSREYKNYLTEKYECLTSKDYSVAINSSFLSEAAGDEKKAEWLEYNLKLIPETVEKTKAQVAARGAKILSYNITINGYNSMTAELCTQVEVDPGTEKARKELEERFEKKKEEKKVEEKKREEKAAEKAAEEERLYKLRMDGTDVADVTEKITDAVSSVNVGENAENGYVVFDARA